jgi:MSHA biogenesis protein MshP
MRQQRGVVIVAAIFILVVLSALGAFVVGVSTNQQVGSALDVQTARAYQAARAGVEWGMYASLVASPGSCPGGGGSSTHSFVPPSLSSLSGMTVTVRCVRSLDANAGPTVFAITATACNQPLAAWSATTAACPNTSTATSLYVERQIGVGF